MTRPRHYLGFGWCIHWGDPRNPVEIVAHVNRYSYRPIGELASVDRETRVEHRVRRWYGVSWKRRLMLAFFLFGSTTEQIGVAYNAKDGGRDAKA